MLTYWLTIKTQDYLFFFIVFSFSIYHLVLFFHIFISSLYFSFYYYYINGRVHSFWQYTYHIAHHILLIF